MAKTSLEEQQKLLGYTFQSGWKVVKIHSTSGTSTGGVYSMCFDVEKDGRICFMKALDLKQYMSRGTENGTDPMACLKIMIDQYQYERSLSEICKEGNVRKVVYVIDSGQEFVSVFNMLVPYLVFEMADDDIHHMLDVAERLEFSWKMKSLHDVAVGMYNLHKVGITHQDIKPSNILQFNDETKIGDLGCSSCEALDSPYKDRLFTGDHNYSPPERSYNWTISDSSKQKYLTDCYLLGSLIVFYITGVSMNALLYRYLPESYLPDHYQGDLDPIRSYLNNAFALALEEIKKSIPEIRLRDRLLQTIEYLCSPIPEYRGHPKNLSLTHGNPYSLERFISTLDLMKREAEILVLKK